MHRKMPVRFGKGRISLEIRLFHPPHGGHPCHWLMVPAAESIADFHRQDIAHAGHTRGFTFGIAPKVTKGLGPKPPKAEKPGDIPKIRKFATLKQYGFFNGIPPGFSPAERFFRQGPGGTGITRVAGVPPYVYDGHLCRVWYLTPLFCKTSTTPKTYTFW